MYEEMADAEKKQQDQLLAQWQESSVRKTLSNQRLFSSFLALCASGPGGMTPLHLAAVNGHTDCVIIMLGMKVIG